MTSIAGGQPATLTPAQIVDGWDNGLRAIEKIHHQAGNFRVRVQGNEADASCYGIAYHYRRTRSGRNTRVFVGSYDFKLRGEREQWKVSAFATRKQACVCGPALAGRRPAEAGPHTCRQI
jgi:hypothetical protein